MAYLTKEQYSRRRENAAIRNMENAEIAMENGMTEDQAELITELCSLRHEIHSQIDRLYYLTNSEQECRALKELNIRIKKSGLIPMSFVPSEVDDYIDIDDLDTFFETEQVPEDEDERAKWFDDKKTMIYDQWETMNENIEHYLEDIDTKFHTHFCPTGALRVF